MIPKIAPHKNGVSSSGLPDARGLLEQLSRERALRLQAEAENASLRKQIAGKNRTSKIVLCAVRDAYELLMRHITDFSVSRETMLGEGMSIRRWQWAIACLRYCAVLSTRHKVFVLKWFSSDGAELVELFEEGTKRLLEAPKPLESLKEQLPKSVRGDK